MPAPPNGGVIGFANAKPHLAFLVGASQSSCAVVPPNTPVKPCFDVSALPPVFPSFQLFPAPSGAFLYVCVGPSSQPSKSTTASPARTVCRIADLLRPDQSVPRRGGTIWKSTPCTKASHSTLRECKE